MLPCYLLLLHQVLRAVSASAGPADGCDEGPGRIYESPSAFGMKKMFARAYMDLGVPLHRVRYMGKKTYRHTQSAL